MTQVTAQPKRRIGLLIWLIVSQLLAVASLLLWIVMVGVSSMAVFADGAIPADWAIVIAVCAYPLFPLIMAFSAWIAFAFRKNRLAAVLTGLTIVPPVVLVVVVLIWSGNLPRLSGKNIWQWGFGWHSTRRLTSRPNRAGRASTGRLGRMPSWQRF